MYELEKTEEVKHLIDITQSNSGISGPELVKAHIRLGEILGAQINLDPMDTTVVAVLRGGIFFAQGIYMALGCKFALYDPRSEKFSRPNTKNVILVDSVINTGRTINTIRTPDMYVACCVINEKAVKNLDENLYTVRISKNEFVGSKISKQSGNVGPDTTMRLFNQI